MVSKYKVFVDAACIIGSKVQKLFEGRMYEGHIDDFTGMSE